jgi:glycine/D-amino acid oxidase-like deaminating enzyme
LELETLEIHIKRFLFIGECPEIGNYYICAGMNGNSLQGAGGVGKAVADWMVGFYSTSFSFFRPFSI